MNRHIKAATQEIIRRLVAVPPMKDAIHRLVLANRIPEYIWSRIPISETFLLQLPDDKQARYRSTTGDAIGRRLYWMGMMGYESESTDMFWKLAKSSRTVLDIGANTGLFSILACAANPDARVIAFEPVPRTFRHLQSNISLNGWLDRCVVRNDAVSDSIGLAQLHVPHDAVPHSASLNPDGFLQLSGDIVDVHVTTIDAVCAGFQSIDLAKVDVEGFEANVLRGMQNVLSDSRPVVFLEVLDEGPASEIESILFPLNYNYYKLGPDGWYQTDGILQGGLSRSRNVIACPSEKYL